MRIWHYKLIPALPKSQLVSQWRELNSVYNKQDNHILINYIYKYPKSTLKHYSDLVINEMIKRGYKITKWDNYNKYFDEIVADEENFDEHNNMYLEICYYNLMEKWIRGQKDFDLDTWIKIGNIMKENM